MNRVWGFVNLIKDNSNLVDKSSTNHKIKDIGRVANKMNKPIKKSVIG